MSATYTVGSVAHEAASEIAARYGWRLTIEQIAEVLKLSPGTIRNRIAEGRMPMCYRDGGRIFADARDVAAYLDGLRPALSAHQVPAEPRQP